MQLHDYKTVDVVKHIFHLMGYKILADFVEKDIQNLDRYIRLIKIKCKSYPHFKDLVNYFL